MDVLLILQGVIFVLRFFFGEGGKAVTWQFRGGYKAVTRQLRCCLAATSLLLRCTPRPTAMPAHLYEGILRVPTVRVLIPVEGYIDVHLLVEWKRKK